MKHRNIHSERSISSFILTLMSAFLSWSALKLLGEGAAVDLRTVPAIVGGDQKTPTRDCGGQIDSGQSLRYPHGRDGGQRPEKMSGSGDGSAGSCLLPGEEPEADGVFIGNLSADRAGQY